MTLELRVRLQSLRSQPGLSAAAASTAAELLSRMDAPVRLTLFGLPGSGKSRLANLLIGATVLPPGLELPTLQLSPGERERTTATLPDGTTRRWPGRALADLVPLGAMMAELELPLPAVKLYPLLRIAADADPEDQVAAMAWAAPRTDIALWCSAGFRPAEAAIWARAPEQMRQSAFLIATGTGPAPAADGFRQRFVVAIDAAPEGPPLPGLAALAAAIDRSAALAREAEEGRVLLFLNRYERRSPAQRQAERVPTRPASRPLSHPLTERPLSVALAERPLSSILAERVAEPAAPPAPVAERRLSTPVLPARPATVPLPPQKPAAPTPAPAPLSAAAVEFLRLRARELSRQLPEFGTAAAPRVLGHCLETMEQLVEQVSAPDEMTASDAEIEELVLDAADVIMLLQAEPGTGPAADAVTLLLQLRRDLEARLAA